MKLRHIPFLFLLAATTGCSDFFNQIVDIDIPEHEPVLAVSGHFRAQDSTLTVYVSRSVGILDPVAFDTIAIEGASVTVLRDGQPWQTLPDKGAGYYRLNLDGPLGDSPSTYSLRVSAPGYSDATAEQTMPSKVDITSTAYQPEGGVNPDGLKTNTLTVEFQDPAGEDNYYLLEAFVTIPDTFGGFEYNLCLATEDVLAESYNCGLLFRDGPIDGKSYALKTYFLDNVHEISGATVTVRLFSISRDRYLFLRTLDLYYNAQDNPFAEPVVVHDNIEDGVGIFTVGAVAERVFSF
ncbi:MAG: DUF4249 domain-containing protein [Saprospiraceae bacterium]